MARCFVPWQATALALATSSAASAADLPSVEPGLWHVTSHASFDPDPQPGATSWPFLPGKPRDRDEDICLSQSRARMPMPPPTGDAAELRFIAPDTLVATATQSGANGRGGSTDWLYRRVDDKAFDGHWQLSTEGMRMGLEYHARFVASQCGDVRPSSPSRFGEP